MIDPSKLTTNQKRDYIRRKKAVKGREDLLYLCKDILGYDSIDVEVHGKLDDKLKSPKKRKLILLPRGSFKSTIITIGGNIQAAIKNPDIRILIDSEILDNSMKFLGQIKRDLSKGSFRKVYGNLVSSKHRETAKEFTTTLRRNENLKEATFTATGIGTVNVGMHYDRIVIDDPHSEKNISTKEQIEKVRDHYRLLLSLLEPGGELIVVGTRWHFYDLYNWLLEEEINDSWDVYVEAAVKPDGTLFFPNRLTRAFLAEQRRAQGAYLFSCQYMNNPVDEETQCFKRKDFRYWGGEDDDYPMSEGSRVVLNLYLLIDRAFSTKASADFTGVICAGVSTTGNVYILDAIRKKCGLQELTDIVYRLMSRYGEGRFRSVNVETINYEEIEEFFRDQMRKRNKYFILNRLRPDSRISKQGRIESALQARYANHTVFHKRGMMDLEDELVKFPKGTHDDLIDPAAYIVQVMTVPGDPKNEVVIERRPSGWFGPTAY